MSNINDKLRKSKIFRGFMIFTMFFMILITLAVSFVEKQQQAEKQAHQAIINLLPQDLEKKTEIKVVKTIKPKEYRDLMNAYYSELMAIKSNRNFWQGGYGSGLGARWSAKVILLRERSHSLQTHEKLALGVFPSELLSLGLEYVFSNGQKTEESLRLRKLFNKALKP